MGGGEEKPAAAIECHRFPAGEPRKVSPQSGIRAQMGPKRGLSKYAADGRRYEDRRSEQEQSSNDLFVQGTAALLTTRIVFGGSHFIRP